MSGGLLGRAKRSFSKKGTKIPKKCTFFEKSPLRKHEYGLASVISLSNRRVNVEIDCRIGCGLVCGNGKCGFERARDNGSCNVSCSRARTTTPPGTRLDRFP